MHPNDLEQILQMTLEWIIYCLNDDTRRMYPIMANYQCSLISSSSIRSSRRTHFVSVNPLTPNETCRGRTAPLTSKRCILYIYSTNVGTEYSKHGTYTPAFFFQNEICFIILTYLVPVLFTFYIFIQQIQVLNILNTVYTLRFFSSK